MFNGKIFSDHPDFSTFMEERPKWRECPHCNVELEQECVAHDPCIKDCPGTEDACCGHGFLAAAYVTLEDGEGEREVLRGDDALDYFLAQGLGWK